MAGDWIKLQHVTADKPEVFLMADHLGIDPDAVLGKLCRIWIWADQQTMRGDAPSVTQSLLDRVASMHGFADAMVLAGWLVRDENGYRFPNFERHNGQTAKARGLTANRMTSHRAQQARCDAPSVTQASRERHASVEKASPEKRREEEEEGMNHAHANHATNGDPKWLTTLRTLTATSPPSRDLVERIAASVQLGKTPRQSAPPVAARLAKGGIRDPTGYLATVVRSFESRYDPNILTRRIDNAD